MLKWLLQILFWAVAVCANPLIIEGLSGRDVHPATTFKLWVLFILLTLLAAIMSFYPKLKPYFTKYGKVTGVFFSVYLFVFLIVIIEFGFHWVLSANSTRPVMIGEQELVQKNTLLGYLPKPDTNVIAAKVLNKDTLYHTQYEIDNYSRRKIKETPATKHLLFFGGSFTFGQGVAQGESFAEQTATSLEDYQAYNYGFFGYGPQQMLIHLNRPDFLEEINNRDTGIAIYTLIDHHFMRNPPAMGVYNSYGGNFPFYDFNSNGELTYYEPLGITRPNRASLYKFLSGSKILEYFHFNLPQKLKEEDYERMATLLAKAQDHYHTITSADNPFIVVLFPGTTLSEKIIPQLEKQGVNYLDYSGMASLEDEQWFYKYDRHPKAEMHLKVAQQLAKDITNQF